MKNQTARQNLYARNALDVRFLILKGSSAHCRPPTSEVRSRWADSDMVSKIACIFFFITTKELCFSYGICISLCFVLMPNESFCAQWRFFVSNEVQIYEFK